MGEEKRGGREERERTRPAAMHGRRRGSIANSPSGEPDPRQNMVKRGIWRSRVTRRQYTRAEGEPR